MVERVIFFLIGLFLLVFSLIMGIKGIMTYKKIHFKNRITIEGTVSSRVATTYENGIRYNCLISYEYNGLKYYYTYPYKKIDSNELPEKGEKVKFSIDKLHPEILKEYQESSLLMSIVCLLCGVVAFILCLNYSIFGSLFVVPGRRCGICLD